MIDGRISFNENPLELLADTYHFLDMEHQSDRPAAHMIWDHDNDLLQTGIDFYNELNNRLEAGDWIELDSLLREGAAPEGFEPDVWSQVRSAHLGFQAGLDIIGVLPALAERSGFFELKVNQDLSLHIPDRLTEKDHQARMAKVLVPPPAAKGDEILAESGGMFYARETPESEPYVTVGSRFEKGDPLYIVEVMKMFNKVYAPFAGTIEEILVEDDGVIISKGQPLYRITPDEIVVEESEEDRTARRRDATQAVAAWLI